MSDKEIKIIAMQEADIPRVQEFLLEQLATLFNKQSGQTAITKDILGLKEAYLLPARNQLWLAYSEPEQKVVGTIAISQYNGRIKLLEGRYQLAHTAEVGRCYVSAELRGKGIGSRLLAVAENFCRQYDYRTLYLHTHHFLSGGLQFWLKKGFVITIDEGGDYQLVHMEKQL